MKGFFRTLADINAQHKTNYTFSTTVEGDNVTVTLIPNVEGKGEKGKNIELPPFNAKGNADDLDQNFAEAFEKAMDLSKDSITDIREYSESIKEQAKGKKPAAAKQSAKEKEDTDGEEKTAENGTEATETKVATKKAAPKKPAKIPKDIQDGIKQYENYLAKGNVELQLFCANAVVKKLEGVEGLEDEFKKYSDIVAELKPIVDEQIAKSRGIQSEMPLAESIDTGVKTKDEKAAEKVTKEVVKEEKVSAPATSKPAVDIDDLF